jgi:hypothetical protein
MLFGGEGALGCTADFLQQVLRRCGLWDREPVKSCLNTAELQNPHLFGLSRPAGSPFVGRENVKESIG